MNRTHPGVIDPTDTLLVNLPHRGKFAALGDVLLVEPIGVGGMGRVYLGFDHRLERWVAVKLRRPEDERDAERFRQEGVALAGIASEHLVQVHAHGEAGDVHYLVMELVNGEDLTHRVARLGGRLDLGQALAILLAATSGVVEAHRSHIWHRDLKPGNILIAASGAVKVADLGIAKVTRPGAIGLTLEDTVMGTVGYMAPELFRGAQHAGPASDVFALGATLAYLLVGRSVIAPAQRGDVREAIARANAFPDLAEFGVQLPPAIAATLAKATAPEPDDRFGDAEELLLHLREATAGITLRTLADANAERYRPAHFSMLRMQVDAGLEQPERQPSGLIDRRTSPTDEVQDRVVPAPPGPKHLVAKAVAATVVVGAAAAVLLLNRGPTTGRITPSNPPVEPPVAAAGAAGSGPSGRLPVAAPVDAVTPPSEKQDPAPTIDIGAPKTLRIDAGTGQELSVDVLPRTASVLAQVSDGELHLQVRQVAEVSARYELVAKPSKKDVTATVVWTATLGTARSESRTEVQIRGIDHPPTVTALAVVCGEVPAVEVRAGSTLRARARIADPDDAPELVVCRCLLDGEVVQATPAASDGSVEFVVPLPTSGVGARTVTIAVGEGRADQHVEKTIRVLPAVAPDSIAFAIDSTHLEATQHLPALRTFFLQHFRALGLTLVDDPATAAYTLELFVGPAPARPEVAHPFLRLRRNVDQAEIGVPYQVGLTDGTEVPDPAARLRAAWQKLIERIRHEDKPGRTWSELIPAIRDSITRDIARSGTHSR
ncbi:MAG: serine/threonine protein kinase [Planctomycetes bacterium]|nr:serine/threonine protein kinase [Planctomycetota bacterium]